MSRELPEKPNLEFLKKQAKELLRAMPDSKLADAQHTLATEYGFANWPELKKHVEASALTRAEALKVAVCESDAVRTRHLLSAYPELRASIDRPLPGYAFGQHALFAAVQRSDRATIDVLLQAGANINHRTEWWAGGFGVLDECDPELVPFLTERGAIVDAHSAARLGMVDVLRTLLADDPSLVHAPGGDGQTPLHFASTPEVAELLLTHGAVVDARCIDHESTPAQYMLRVDQKRHYAHDRQDVARYLLAQGCQSDLLMAAALGDLELVNRHLMHDPSCIHMQVSDKWFPKKNPRAGGTIYIWTLGKNRTAHTVARQFGREEVFQFLLAQTPPELKLALACELGDVSAFRQLLHQHPNLTSHLSEDEARKLPDAAENNNTEAVKLMLEAGWPVDARGQMGATALHWAGYNGNAEMARQILRFRPTLELKSLEYQSTALAWAVHGSGNSWLRDTGDFVATVEALVQAGAALPPNPELSEPSEAVLALLRQDTSGESKP